MKKYLLPLMLFLGMVSIKAQNVFDYETPETIIPFQFFGGIQEGVVLEPIANPNPSGINISATVYPFTELADGPEWAGGFSNPDPAGGIDATNGGEICIDVHFSETNSLTVKLENGTAEDEWQLTVQNDVLNEWTTLCFDLTQAGEANNSMAAGKMFSRLVLFHGLGEAAPEEQVIYIDNIVFPEGGGSGETTTIILDAETAETTAGLFHFGSTLADSIVAPVPNPNISGINESSTVFELNKPANAQPWAGAFTNPNPITPVDASSGKICLDVHMDHIGTISVKFEEAMGGAPNWIQSVSNTLVNEWETVCIDFTAPSLEDPFTPAIGDTYSKLVFFADFLVDAADVDVITYFDNVRVISSGEIPEYEVTFNVDMNGSTETFTQMYLSGSFNDWSGNANPMNDDNADGVWTTTVILPIGSHEYKFSFDDWTGSEDLNKTNSCTVTTDGFTNRIVSVSADTNLDEVCYASCYACGTSANITWNVGVGDPSDTGVWLAGGAEFGAPGGNYEMSDEDGDGVYSVTIERLIGWEGFYTFTNGNCPDFSCKENIAGQDCAYPDNFNDRYLDAGTTEVNTCFAECTTDTNCAPPAEPTMTTFSVDMNEVATVSADGVNLFGQFSNWGNIPMTDDDGDGVWTVTIELDKTIYEYKFKNGVDGENQESLVEGSSCTVSTPDGMFTNRLIDLTEAEATSSADVVCYESCEACMTNTNDLEANNNLIKLYPTIAQDIMYLDVLTSFDNGIVQIISLQGELMNTIQIGNNTTDNAINVANYPQGTYILSLTTDTFRSTQRFVKM